MKKGLLLGTAVLAVPVALAILVAVSMSTVAAGLSAGGGGTMLYASACLPPADGSVEAGDGMAIAARAAADAGFRGEDLVIAVAVAGPESSYTADAMNPSGAAGMWQILRSAHQDLFAKYRWDDPADNAKMAYSVWKAAGSWRPWVGFTSGAYARFMDEARLAVAALGALPDVPAGDAASSFCTPGGDGSGSPAQPGGSSGTVPDPTGTGGFVTGATAHMLAEVYRVFGRWPGSCWDRHAWNPSSDHPKGHACDLTVGRLGSFPGEADKQRGWNLASWLVANRSPLSISYVIWQGRIWSASRASEGWRPYGGGGVYNPLDATGGHYDHVHVSVSR